MSLTAQTIIELKYTHISLMNSSSAGWHDHV